MKGLKKRGLKGLLMVTSDAHEGIHYALDQVFPNVPWQKSTMTVMILPAGMRRFYRTSNHIERLNKELKRRSKVIGIFPNEDSLLRLMGSVLIERHEAVQNGRAVFSKEHYDALLKSEAPLRLVELAEEQHLLLAA